MTWAFCAALRRLPVVAVLGMIGAPVDAKACAMTEGVAAQIQQESPSAEIRLVDVPLADRLQIGISALVGRRLPPGGHYLLAHVAGELTIYVARFEDSCATHHGWFPQDLVRAWLEGSPA